MITDHLLFLFVWIYALDYNETKSGFNDNKLAFTLVWLQYWCSETAECRS